MANSDYTNKPGLFEFCPVGYLTTTIGRLDTVVVMTGYNSPVPNGIRIGMAAMIDNEIVVVKDRNDNNLSLGRGCCDTIPAIHSAGAAIWFFDDLVGRDTTQYGGTETVAVKMRPRVAGGTILPIEHAPPRTVTFNLRFARPYPPGLVEVNGLPWFEAQTLNDIAPLTITWAHRNRITQQDVLVDHPEASITPEIGTTYRIQVFDNSSALLDTYTAIGSADTFDYTWTAAMADFGATEGTGTRTGYLTLATMRDGLASFQQYRIDFTLDTDPYGLGYRLGAFLGGYPA